MPQERGTIPSMRGLAMAAGVFAIVVAAVMAAIFLPLREHARRESPDGAFVAIARTPLLHFAVVMPGQGSDRPGEVTLYHGDRSCGSVWVHVVSQLYDLRWDLDSKPRRASLNLRGTWNLDGCSLERWD
jgi:hypothetical protein